ncbi:MAG: hypothetical protein ACTSQI_06900 [Candidatus Helarchaeota archaeon]
MFHLAAIVNKATGKYLFYHDYWDKYPDHEPFFKFFTTYIPFVVREHENTYKMVRWDKLRIAFGHFNEVVIILGGTVETSDKLFEDYLIRTYELLLGIFGDLSTIQNAPEHISEFARELDLMIRASATKDDLIKMDWTVDERYGVTQASEEVNRRNALHSEQASKLLEQFAVEMLENNITKYRLFLTAAVRLTEAVHYEVIVDFSTYPHPPIFDLPPKLHDILGDAGEALETIQNWDPVHPPDWVDVIQELEQKVYRSETHLIEPIVEEPAVSSKKKGFAKQLPSHKAPKGIPYPPSSHKEAKGIHYPQDTVLKAPIPQPSAPPFKVPSSPKKDKPVPFQMHPPPPSAKKSSKLTELTCPNCGFIFKSTEQTTCPVCGSRRLTT